MAELAGKHGFLDVVPVSAEKGVNLDRLIDVIAARLPESPELFPPEQRTDRGEDFQISETIREKLTMELVEELPYGIAVEIEKKEEVEGRLVIDAVIWVDRAGQKPIVIGAKGSRLKRIGQQAREELNAQARQTPAPQSLGQGARGLGRRRAGAGAARHGVRA